MVSSGQLIIQHYTKCSETVYLVHAQARRRKSNWLISSATAGEDYFLGYLAVQRQVIFLCPALDLCYFTGCCVRVGCWYDYMLNFVWTNRVCKCKLLFHCILSENWVKSCTIVKFSVISVTVTIHTHRQIIFNRTDMQVLSSFFRQNLQHFGILYTFLPLNLF